MSTHADTKPWTVPALAQAKRDGNKLVMLTAYDNSFARVMDANGVDLVLVGDSLGMVAVSYTHLDVYKRQVLACAGNATIAGVALSLIHI